MVKFHLNRETYPTDRPTRVEPLRGDGTDANGRIGLDNFRRVTPDEALELTVHHLALAAIFYEATPHDEAAVLAEVERLLASGIDGFESSDLIGARAWLAAMNAYYATLKRQQDAAGR